MREVLEITVEWSGTVIDVRHLGAGERFVLDADCAYGGLDDLLPPDGLTLALVGETDFRVVVPVGAAGAHWGEATSELPADAAQSIALASGARVRCTFGPITLYFARVPAAVRPARRTLAGVFGDLKSFGSAALLHALVVIVAIAVPPTKQALSLDRFLGDDRFVDVILTPSDPVEPPTANATGDAQEDGDVAPKDAPADAVAVTPGPARPEPMVRPAPTRDERKAAAKGAAEELAGVMQGELFAGGDPLGAVGTNALASLNGIAQGDGEGLGGGDSLFAGVGAAPGPHGGPKGSLTTRGVRATCTDCRTVQTAFGKKQPKTLREPKIIPQKPIIADGLNREEVMRIIRTKKSQYRTCYEKALQQDRDLEGKIRVVFTVGPQGQVLVAKADENTVSDAVADCITRRMKAWRFPKPRGGGLVEIRYPFLFRRPG